MNVQPFLFGDGWIEVRDGNDTARDIFDRHYSARRGRKHLGFVGVGEKLVLLTPDAKALFVWCRSTIKRYDGQTGVNCTAFRNEGQRRSSDLIRAADALADERWPGTRHFTYVNPHAIRSTNPGCCFKAAGWRFCGISKTRHYHILERKTP